MSKEIMDAVRDTCMLVKLSTTALGISRTDKGASEDVVSDKKAAKGSAKVIVNRLPGADAYHRAIMQVHREAKEIIERNTMYFDKQWRLLPNRRFEPMVQELAVVKAKDDQLKAKLVENAAHIVRNAHANKGEFDIDIPTETEIINAYHMATEFYPVPSGDHFKGLPESTARKLSARLEAQIAKGVEDATTDVLERFRKPLAEFVEKMHKYDERLLKEDAGEKVGQTGAFRDTAVGNIQDMYKILSSFNVTGDERITELGRMVQELADTDPAKLRKDKTLRDVSVQRAQKIASTLDSWLTPVGDTNAAG